MNFGTKLRLCRKKMSLSQKELGQKIGVAESTVSLYESNKRFPDADTLMKISTNFSCDRQFFCFTYKGTSMEPTLQEGDVVVVKNNRPSTLVTCSRTG